MREIKINEGKEEIEDFLKENLGVGAEERLDKKNQREQKQQYQKAQRRKNNI